MKKYMGINTLKSLMDNILSVVPSKEITEVEVQEMYDATNDETTEEVSGVKIVLPANSYLGTNCVLEAELNSGDTVTANVAEDGSATLELTEDQYNDIASVYARNLETTQTYYAEVTFDEAAVVDGVVTLTTIDLGLF